MKHILPLTLLLIAPAASAANPLEFYQQPYDVEMAPDMDGVNKILVSEKSSSSSYTSKTDYGFDGDLRPISIASFELRDAEWVPIETQTTEWDAEGRCVKRETPFSKYEWEFDTWGRLTKYVSRTFGTTPQSSDIVMLMESLREYGYTDEGIQNVSVTLSSRLADPVNNGWRISGTRYEREYMREGGKPVTDKNGKPIQTSFRQFSYDQVTKEWTLSSSQTNEYSTEGDLDVATYVSYHVNPATGELEPTLKVISKTGSFADGLFQIETSSQAYTILADGTEQLSNETLQEFAENVDGAPYAIKQNYTYYSYNGEVREIRESSRSTSLYDEAVVDGARVARSLGVTREMWDAATDTWRLYSKTMTEYDSEGRTVKMQNLSYQGDVLYMGSGLDREYDSLGRAVKVSVYEVLPPGGGELTLSRRLEYSFYGETNAPIKCDDYQYVIYDGGDSELKLSTVTSWDYDYAISSEVVGSMSSTIPHKQSGSFLCLSKTETNATDGYPINTTTYTYADRSDLSGVEGVAAEAVAEGAAEYYDLRGVRVAAPNLAPGLYIRRQGTSATKVLIR